MASWEGKVAIMMDDYIKGQEDLTIRQNLFLSFLKSLGRVVTNCSAEHAYFTVKKSRPPVETYAEGNVISFAPRALWDQAHLGWRGYISTDKITLHENMENKSNVAIVKRSGEIMENLTEGVTDNFATDLMIDGDASGNTSKIQGVDTFMDDDSSNTVVGDIVAYPEGSYFGISLLPGQDGSWTSDLATSPNTHLATDWPEGHGSPEYDYWTPKLPNWSSTNWGTGLQTWQANGPVSLRRTAQWLRMTNGANAGENLIAMMAGHMLTDLKEGWDSLGRVLLPHKKATDLGFPEVMNYEGLGLHADFSVPVNTCYILNFTKLELCSLWKSLLFRFGPTWVLEQLSYLYLVGFYGNLRTKSPKYHAKLKNFKSS